MSSPACARAAKANIVMKARTINAEATATRRWSLRSETKYIEPLPCCYLVLQDRDRPALAGRLEVDDAGAGGEDRVVAAETGALAGHEGGAALAADHLAARRFLAGEALDPEHVGVRFAAVAAGAEAFLMSH